MEGSSSHTNLYKIGAIAALTGLSTHTIRAWERRYGLELADRTEGGTRLYSDQSLERLKAIKRLLDKGESISVLSELTIPELKERLDRHDHLVAKPVLQWDYGADGNGTMLRDRAVECRLIYKSVPSGDFVSNDTVVDIVEKGAVKNSEKGITGLLILTGNEFLQVLEGPTREVNELYLTIARDDRHRDIRLISFEQITKRYFQTWNMRLVDLYDLPGSTRQYLMNKYENEDGMIKIPESSMEIHSLLLDAKSFCLSEPWNAKAQ